MSGALLPIPQIPVSVRVATPDDVPFIDRLQKMHSKSVGFMQTQAIEGKIAAGQVLVAEEMRNDECGMRNEEQGAASSHQFSIPHSAFSISPRERVGYVIVTDRYFKRDDVGIIYQLNVVPGRQRGFVGATLLRAMFDRAAYGCRQFCCWCAQDIEANRFWEAMGFVPLAYRAGSRRVRRKDERGRMNRGASLDSSFIPQPSSFPSARVHIFWQKRIRRGDATTPWWIPSQTTGGSIREDRLVLPIPPGTHWSKARPVLLPQEPMASRQLAGVRENARKPREQAAAAKPAPVTRASGLRFGLSTTELAARDGAKSSAPVKAERKPREKKRNDPRLVAAARELKDRWLEHLNSGGAEMTAVGKYDVTRAIGCSGQTAQLDSTHTLALPSPEGRGMKPMAA